MAWGGDLMLLLADGGATLRTPGLLAQVVSLAQNVAVAAAQLFSEYINHDALLFKTHLS